MTPGEEEASRRIDSESADDAEEYIQVQTVQEVDQISPMTKKLAGDYSSCMDFQVKTKRPKHVFRSCVVT